VLNRLRVHLHQLTTEGDSVHHRQVAAVAASQVQWRIVISIPFPNGLGPRVEHIE